MKGARINGNGPKGVGPQQHTNVEEKEEEEERALQGSSSSNVFVVMQL